MISSTVRWDNQVRNMDGEAQQIHAVAVQPKGEHVVAAVGHRVLVYELASGELVKALKGHKSPVYAVAYARDSARFASGSADKSVIIWTSELQGILRYKHHDAVYALAFNPVSLQLASCTGSDFGLWSPEKNSVEKTKVGAKIVSCAWSRDGQHLALGLWDGGVSIRSKDGRQLVAWSRGSDPVWALAWRPGAGGVPILAVADWSQRLAFFSVTGRQVGREVALGFDPTSMVYWEGSEEYLLIGGSNSELSLYSRDGVAIGTMVGRDGWVWSVSHVAGRPQVALGCADGSVSLHDVAFPTVHALHGQRYAARSAMTSVVVTDLVADDKTTIDVRAPIERVALYNARLAVLVPAGIVVYELYAAKASETDAALLRPLRPAAPVDAASSDSDDDDAGSSFRKVGSFAIDVPCSLLVATGAHVVVCHDASLVLFGMDGGRVREWTLSAPVRYVKIVGGPVGGEGLLVGLRSGAVLKLFVNSPFPVALVDVGSSVRCLDLSASRTSLAVVDEHASLMVYDVSKPVAELVYTEHEVNSVAFNAHFEELLCFSTTGGKVMKMKAGAGAAVEREVPGFVVGFVGPRVFALDGLVMRPRELPLGPILDQYLGARNFAAAYGVACLGVTEAEWKRLAVDALLSLELAIARKAFTRIRELRYIELVDTIERAAAAAGADDSVLLGHILAFQGKIPQAAKLYERANAPKLALDMYVDLGDLDAAEALAAKYGIPVEELMQKREASVVGSGDWRALVELYHTSGQHTKVVATLAEALAEDSTAPGDKLEVLAQVVEGLSAQEKDALREAAKLLMAHGQRADALTAYTKLGDIKSVVALRVALAQWDAAFAVAAEYPAYAQDVYVPYAEWLLERDEFDAAIRALGKSGARDRSVMLLEALITNAVSELRFDRAAAYYWTLSAQYLSEVTVDANALTGADKKKLKKFSVYYYKAEIYYAFQFVKAYIDEPFNPHLGSADAVFNIARYLLTRIDRVAPKGVSKVYTLTALARLGLDCGAHNLARQTLEKLTNLVVPTKWLYELDAMAIATRTKLADAPALADAYPVCARCTSVAPLVARGGACATCHHEFQVSFYSFDTLPLVEFVLPDSLTPAAAAELLAADSLAKVASAAPRGPAVPSFVVPDASGRQWREGAADGAETLTLHGGSGSGGRPSASPLIDELFGDQLIAVTSSDRYVPFEISRAGLARLDASQVLVKEWPCPAMRTQFWINLTPALPIYACTTCNHFFHEEDYELHILMDGSACPVCGTAFVEDGVVVVDDDDDEGTGSNAAGS